MELIAPFKNDEEKKRCFIYVVASIFLFFLFDYCYELNIFYLRNVPYYKGHTVPAFLYSISNVPFIISTMYTLAKFSRGIVEWFKYVATFAIDVCAIYVIFAFRDPQQENTTINNLLIVSIMFFVIKLILFNKWKQFKNLKII